MIVVTVAALAVVSAALHRAAMPSVSVAYAYGVFLAFYWMARISLRRRAARLAPVGTVSLLPTAVVPWKFIGARSLDGEIHLFDLSALDGRLSRERLQEDT